MDTQWGNLKPSKPAKCFVLDLLAISEWDLFQSKSFTDYFPFSEVNHSRLLFLLKKIVQNDCDDSIDIPTFRGKALEISQLGSYLGVLGIKNLNDTCVKQNVTTRCHSYTDRPTNSWLIMTQPIYSQVAVGCIQLHMYNNNRHLPFIYNF